MRQVRSWSRDRPTAPERESTGGRPYDEYGDGAAFDHGGAGSRHGHITRVKLVRSVYSQFEVVTLATGS